MRLEAVRIMSNQIKGQKKKDLELTIDIAFPISRTNGCSETVFGDMTNM